MLGALQRGGIALAGLAITLLLAECLVRIFSDIHPPLKRRDLVLGARYTPNLDVEIDVDESHQRVRLRFNDVGFRGPTRTRTKPAGTCRVAVIGDSQISAIATQEDETFVRKLESGLQAIEASARWEVLNFGVSGSSTAQELVLYRKLVSDFEPDLVILAYFEGNDLVDNSDRLSWTPRIYMDLDDEGRLFQKPRSVTRAYGSSWLNRNSRFYVWQKRLVNRATRGVLDEKGLNVRGSGVGRAFETRADADLTHAWQLTRVLLRTFYDDVRKDGADFLLMYIPAAEAVDPEVWQRRFGKEASESLDPKHAERQIASIALDHGLAATFLSDLFRSELSAGRGPLFFNGEGHINERAQALAAREVLHQLSRTGTLARLASACGRTHPPAGP